MSQPEFVGRLIWLKAIAGKSRFHTLQQRIGALVDWIRVLQAEQRDDRFRACAIQ